MYDNEPTMMGYGRPTATLVVRQGPQAGMSFPLAGNQIVIGREEGTDIALQDPEASRRHSLISWQGGQFVIEDLGSTNGTFVNGVQITGPQALNPGDSIGIGQTALVFHLPEAQARAQPPPQQQPPAYAAPPAPAEEGSKTTQYILAGIGCLLLLCICLLLAGAVWILTFPDSLETIIGSIPLHLIDIYPRIG